ncbi:hypothetical protein [Nonomuraea sp. NPDC050783]|uniref:hypothetical protein n=1 Tax=Nonomuraea sp. NPDC050783 TaxID=3154634 RepID=UPI003466422C
MLYSPDHDHRRPEGADDQAAKLPEKAGRWTFQIVEEYDDGYYAAFRELEGEVRDRLTGGRRHVYEAELKQRSQRAGREASG